MPEIAIEIKNLWKTYATGVKALKDITLNIEKGEIFGLLGPNGAGKTTLIGIISGLVKKTSGEVAVFGKNVVKDYKFTRSQIGLVQQEINHDPFFTVREIVDIQGGYFGIPKEKRMTSEILEKLNLLEKADTIGRNLSGGMKKRVMIAKALVHSPEVLFLDEPTAGIDVELRENLWQLIRELKKERKTIILTTHYLEEAEELADRIGIIAKGELVLVENKETLIKRYGKRLKDIYLDIINEGNYNGDSEPAKN